MLTALVTFALVSTITPGPNNLMLMASGANFGFGRTVPHMSGNHLDPDGAATGEAADQ